MHQEGRRQNREQRITLHPVKIWMDPHGVRQLLCNQLHQIRLWVLRPHHALQGGGFCRSTKLQSYSLRIDMKAVDKQFDSFIYELLM